ncbi:helix-turn-helix transcriptional regulator [Paraburkholderia sp. LEh10]|uniref:helix-turn-helix domain-containing protein n=1 Tax=Paraburkholderia sp. LEh10 TaxID=2821353 RepID=UPI001AEB8E90|nr:AraC family transcriptional regulator [Paraburkholderia sp. LEh10]MBP0595830.1 helix-turn-helix transcriptional regulator [Paraburkholderia sp. LEh10]
MNNAQLPELPVLERFLAALDIGVANFTLCDVRDGWSTRFEACRTASLHYCMDGSGALITQHGERVSLSAHSFVLLPPGIAYKIESGKSCTTHETNRARVTEWPWHETVPTVQVGGGNKGISTACGELRLDTTSGSDPFKTLRNPLVAQFDGKSGLKDQFVLLLAESARPGLGSRTLVEALLKQCLVLVLRRQIDSGGADLPWAAGVADRRLASALEAILERSASSLSVERLADIAGMSRSAFAAQFMKAFGQSPMAMLKIVRLKKAAELLATTNYPVAEVAKMVGFSSRSNFSLAFNALHGLDPSAFRRRLTSVRGRLTQKTP